MRHRVGHRGGRGLSGRGDAVEGCRARGRATAGEQRPTHDICHMICHVIYVYDMSCVCVCVCVTMSMSMSMSMPMCVCICMCVCIAICISPTSPRALGYSTSIALHTSQSTRAA
jgi:hypothetical protein